MSSFIYAGQIIHSVTPKSLQIIDNGFVVVENGKIAALETTIGELEKFKQQYQIGDDAVFFLSANQILIPGFIDTHIHGPQYPNIGLGYDLPLLDWLNKYTFPLEEKYSDASFAQNVYQSIVKKTLESGTTTASYFATVHTNTALLLAQEAIKQNQRAFVGKVNMNISSPSGLLETLEETLEGTNQFLRQFPLSDIVKPVITPRFALSCDMACMKGLAEIAKNNDVHIQTHISENQTEVDLVRQQYPDCSSYTDVYDKAGLLTDKTVLAHGIYLSDGELKTLLQRGTSISHCPNSNFSLQSGICPVRHILECGVKMGLGTDCAGGYSVSMLDAMRQSLATTIAAFYKDPQLEKLTLPEVFHMATLGGAQALAIDKLTGNFKNGKQFDALVVDVSGFDLLEEYSLDQKFQKFIYLGDDRSVRRVYVNGKVSVDKE